MQPKHTHTFYIKTSFVTAAPALVWKQCLLFIGPLSFD